MQRVGLAAQDSRWGSVRLAPVPAIVWDAKAFGSVLVNMATKRADYLFLPYSSKVVDLLTRVGAKE